MTDSPFKMARFLEHVRDEAVSRLDLATVAFYGIQNDILLKDRTGVLLRIADKLFILTASHELLEIVKLNIPLFVSWNDRNELPISLHDAKFHTTEWESGPVERDVVRDVAAIKLSDTTAKEILASGRVPLTLLDVCMNQDRSSALFFLFGFPQAWFTMNSDGPRCLPLIYGCNIYKGEHWDGAQIEYDPQVHLLLDFNRNVVTPIDGESHTLPGYTGIKGVSGCGVWRMLPFDGALEDWKADQCRLVAIQHRYYETPGYVHATWIQYAINRIFDDYPELRSAATIVYPS